MPFFSSLNRSFGGGILLIALLALINGVVVLLVLQGEDAAWAARKEAFGNIRDVGAFRAAMLNQETGLRGFLITRRDSSLEPYRWGRSDFESVVKRMQAGTARGAGEANLLAEAVSVARRWQADIGETAIREMQDPASQQIALTIEQDGRGKQFFGAFRARLRAIEAAENSRADQQTAYAARWRRWLEITLLAGCLSVLCLCAIIAFAIDRTIVGPLDQLAAVMQRLVRRDLNVTVPALDYRSEVGAMARAVQVFKENAELDRTLLLRATADSLPAMVGYIDAQQQVGLLNGEFGRYFDLGSGDVSELHGRSLETAFPNSSFPGADKELQRALRGSETRFDHYLRSRDGTRPRRRLSPLP